MTSSATISPCKKYRYTLHRDIPENAHLPLKPLLVIAHNPSTAGETLDDNTIRKLLEFARLWGCTSLTVINLFAYRTAYPKELWAAEDAGVDIVGPDNDRHIRELITSHQGGIILAAWGAGKRARVRAQAVAKLFPVDKGAYFPVPGVQCLDINQDGSPKHPLYVAYDEPLKCWAPPSYN